MNSFSVQKGAKDGVGSVPSLIVSFESPISTTDVRKIAALPEVFSVQQPLAYKNTGGPYRSDDAYRDDKTCEVFIATEDDRSGVTQQITELHL